MKKINKEPTQKQRKEIEKILFLLNDFFPFLWILSKKQVNILNKTMSSNQITFKDLNEFLKEYSRKNSKTFSIKPPEYFKILFFDKEIKFKKTKGMWQYVRNRSKKSLSKQRLIK